MATAVEAVARAEVVSGFDVAAIIVTYNSEDVISRLLDSIPAAMAGLKFETVVVDNGSSDGTRPLVAQRAGVTLVESENIGYAAAINLGVETASPSAAILVLNPDAELGAESVPPLVRRLASPGVGIAVPKVFESSGRVHPSLRREPTLARALGLGRTGWPTFSEYVTDESAYSAPGVVDWAVGAVMLISTDCFFELEGWDPSFFLYSEETDFCLRARDRGWQTWFEPEATVVHAGGGSGRNDRTHTMQILNRVRLYARRHSMLPASCYLGLTILSELTWWARGHPQSRAALRALTRPSARPTELAVGLSVVPR